MKKQTILAGYLMILAAITFWISWFLMPDPGTVDTIHILKIVKEFRMSVLYSVVIQIVSSVLYMISLFLLCRLLFPNRATLAGIILFGIGILGLCSDAFFHLLALFMTDDSVNIQEDVVKVMDFMQTDGVVVLLPILLPFFAGSLVMAAGLSTQKVITKRSAVLIVAALVIGLVSELVVNKILNYRIPGVMLTVLGLFAIGQGLIGLDLIKSSKKENYQLASSDLRIATKEQ